MDIPEKVAIFGLGKTGASLIRFLSKMKRQIIVFDEKEERELKGVIEELEGIEFDKRFGKNTFDPSFDAQLLILSPGIPEHHPFVEEVKKKGKKIMGEIEFAFRFVREPIIAVTGTNGKTTTVTLLGELLKRAFGDVFVGGNIGKPLIDYVCEGRKSRFLVLELSSFQLETIEKFRPFISILLNVTEDHLDRYRSFEEYRNAKFRIFENQDESDFAIVQKEAFRNDKIRAKTLLFTTYGVVEEGAFLKNEFMCVRMNGQETLYRKDILSLKGPHNIENILSVILTCQILGVEKRIIEETIKGFNGLPHRIEKVKELDGIIFYNDSKATNVDATKRAIESFDGDILLIAGGRDKGGSYKALLSSMNKIKAIILIGEAKERIENELGEYTIIYKESNLVEAVRRAKKIAKKGDIVLFSPMCSSFDMFRNYEERGEAFKRIVENL